MSIQVDYSGIRMKFSKLEVGDYFVNNINKPTTVWIRMTDGIIAGKVINSMQLYSERRLYESLFREFSSGYEVYKVKITSIVLHPVD